MFVLLGSLALLKCLEITIYSPYALLCSKCLIHPHIIFMELLSISSRKSPEKTALFLVFPLHPSLQLILLGKADKVLCG